MSGCRHREGLCQLGCRTGCPRLVVSDDAILDHDAIASNAPARVVSPRIVALPWGEAKRETAGVTGLLVSPAVAASLFRAMRTCPVASRPSPRASRSCARPPHSSPCPHQSRRSSAGIWSRSEPASLRVVRGGGRARLGLRRRGAGGVDCPAISRPSWKGRLPRPRPTRQDLGRVRNITASVLYNIPVGRAWLRLRAGGGSSSSATRAHVHRCRGRPSSPAPAQPWWRAPGCGWVSPGTCCPG